MRDTDHGGFHCDFDLAWNRLVLDPGVKSLEFQARTSAAFARAANRWPGRGYDDAARQGLEFLARRMWDRDHGGFYTAVDRSGAPLEHGRKHVHGTLYAVGAFHEAIPIVGAEAKAWRDRGFDWLEQVAWDQRHGGYCGYFTREGRRLRVSDATTVPNDWLGTPTGLKDLNSVVDAVRLLSDLARDDGDARYRDRLDWYVRLIVERLLGPTGLLPDLYADDWTPVPDVIRAGQGFQLVPVLLAAGDALGRIDRIGGVAAALAHRYQDHFAHDEGGFVFARSLSKYPIRGHHVGVPERTWWIHIEACRGFLDLARRGIEPDHFLAAFDTTWALVESRLIDGQRRGFYESVEAGLAATGRKGEPWKDPSHEVHMLLDALNWLGRPSR